MCVFMPYYLKVMTKPFNICVCYVFTLFTNFPFYAYLNLKISKEEPN